VISGKKIRQLKKTKWVLSGAVSVMEWEEDGKNIQSMGIRVSEMEWRGFGWTVIDWDEMLRRRKII